MENITLRCQTCKMDLPPADFYKDTSKKWGIGNRCKPCEKQRMENRTQGKKKFIRQAKDKPCTDCHVKYPYYVMDFDHRPGEDKLFGLDRYALFNLEKVLEEIAKCDVVCANCHRIRTNERR